MMYIKDTYCISPQFSHEENFSSLPVEEKNSNKCIALEPSYNNLIPNSLLRRMGKAVRMAVGAGLQLLSKHEVNGIIVGTANGGLEDCVKFLKQIIEWEEGRLTPTNFVQSTANASSGTLALLSQNNGYNTTHIHKGLAFENALLDALMVFEEKEANQLLVGAVEELSEYNFNIEWQANRFKKNEENLSSFSLLKSHTTGSICGEGSSFFVVADNADNALCKISMVEQFSGNNLPTEKILQLLNNEGIALNSIDALILGNSGDAVLDEKYHALRKHFPNASHYAYKHLVGEYPTSAGFATWLGTKILTTGVPTEFVLDNHSPKKEPKNVLIYNSYLGNQHGLIYLEKV